jgi:hypothetical protein
MPCFPSLSRELVDNEESDGYAAHNHRTELKRYVRRVRAVGYAQSILGNDLRQQTGVPGNIDFDNPVNAVPRRDLKHSFRTSSAR